MQRVPSNPFLKSSLVGRALPMPEESLEGGQGDNLLKGFPHLLFSAHASLQCGELNRKSSVGLSVDCRRHAARQEPDRHDRAMRTSACTARRTRPTRPTKGQPDNEEPNGFMTRKGPTRSLRVEPDEGQPGAKQMTINLPVLPHETSLRGNI